MGGQPLNAPVVDLAPTADGKGYWLVGTDGGIFAFGDANSTARWEASTSTSPWWAWPPTTHRRLLDGRSDGGVFSFNAPFYGSAGNLVLNEPIDGMASTPNGHGYWMVGWDGAIFAYGNARFHGSTGGQPLNAPMVGMAVDRATGGTGWSAPTAASSPSTRPSTGTADRGG